MRARHVRSVCAIVATASVACAPNRPVDVRVENVSFLPDATTATVSGSFDLAISGSEATDVWIHAASLDVDYSTFPISALEGESFPIAVDAGGATSTIGFEAVGAAADLGCTGASYSLVGTLFDEGAQAFVSFRSDPAIFAASGPEGVRWFGALGGGGVQYAEDVALDPAGAALVIGLSRGVADFGGGPLDSGSATVPFVAKLDAAGDHVWSRLLAPANGWSTIEQVGFRRIFSDDDGNVIVAGTFQGSLGFGGEVLATAGGDDVFVAKLSPDGEPLWSLRYGGALAETLFAAGVDDHGGVALAGTFAGSVDFGGGLLSPVGQPDWTNVFVVHLDAAGQHVSSRHVAALEWRTGNLVGAVDGTGAMAIGGSYLGEARFGEDQIDMAPISDAFVLALEADGTPRFTRVLEDSTVVFAAVGTDASGEVLAVGASGPNSIDVGGVVIPPEIASQGFLLRLDAAGQYLAHAGIPGVANGIPVDLATLGDRVVVSGVDATAITDPSGFNVTGNAFVMELDRSGAQLRTMEFGCASHAARVALPPSGAPQILLYGTLLAPIDIGGEILTPVDGSDTFLAWLDGSP
jgi:hypothetical protein